MSWSPRHLLPLHKALADHLVDRRFDEARGDRLAMTVAVPVVHDKALVVLEVTDELLQFGQQPGLPGTAIRGDFPAQALKPLQCRIGAAVPEVPLCPAQAIDQRVNTWPFATVRQPLDHLFEILYPHGDVKPVEYSLATIAKVELGAAHGVAAIGQESYRLVRADAFLRKKRQHPISGLVLECVNVSEAVSATVVAQ
ncbi:hypothetical protein SAMN05192544_104484 [Paraburkholderia hospita]|nr:hypothetical protein SAMN05192544_104484 [Paraburkholderia hospita]